VLTSITKISGGDINIGDKVRILGTGFSSDVFINFNGVPVDIDSIVSNEEMYATIPNGARSGGVKVVYVK